VFFVFCFSWRDFLFFRRRTGRFSMFSLLFQALVLLFGNRQTWCWGWPNLADVFGLIRRCRWIEVFTTLRDTIFGLHVWLHSRRVWEFHIPLQQFRRWALERRWQGRVGRTIVLTLVSVNKKNIRTTITPKLQLCHPILYDGENNFISFRVQCNGPYRFSPATIWPQVLHCKGLLP